jgi:hypothetical protein
MSLNETKICNMALGRIGAKRINDYDDASERATEAILCRLHYETTRDSLLRSHWWRFARSRATLSRNTTDPDFEYSYAYDLPNDFLRMKKPYESDGVSELLYTYSLEGKQLLSNETTMQIQYIRKVNDANEFDPLFVEVLVLQLALKMVTPLAGPGPNGLALRQDIRNELYGSPRMPGLMAKVRAIDSEETNTKGRDEQARWNDARVATGNPLKNYS